MERGCKGGTYCFRVLEKRVGMVGSLMGCER